MTVSIIIPVLDRLAFTVQCLDRVWRNTSTDIDYDVIVVDNGSSDGTREWFSSSRRFPRRVHYHRNEENLGFARANNLGARLSSADYLLFLNNDTLVQPRWLAEMLRARHASEAIGIVGIKQLFPYTNTIYHTGIVFTPDGRPEHLYPHLDASLPIVNKQREYQAVTGACLLIDHALFDQCNGFDEGYRNGYEDIDLCMKVGQRGRKIVCCTTAFIYHYGQVSEGRTARDDRNAMLFAERWSGRLKPDRDDYRLSDEAEFGRSRPAPVQVRQTFSDDCVYLADSLDQGSALTWINSELALALKGKGVPVFVRGGGVSPTLSSSVRQALKPLAVEDTPVGGAQIKWSHYRSQHLDCELAGDINLEFFVINYIFGAPRHEPWDFWLQCLRQNSYTKLPLSEFCRDVLLQTGVSERECHVWYPGYSREITDVEPTPRTSARFRFLTVTNSHDLERYNTIAVIDAFEKAFSPDEDVALVIKDYGASSGNESLRQILARRRDGRIEYISAFSEKRELIRLYQSCDAFVSAHRGEGFGMKILDAMACGLPVVLPLFGGPTAYCRPDNCFPVDFSLTPMGDCLDSQSLHIGNGPLWAGIAPGSLEGQMRRLYEDQAAAKTIGALARTEILERFSWDRAAERLVGITTRLREARPTTTSRPEPSNASSAIVPSPYWLGLRVSVIVPTHNRKDKLLACLEALSHQSVLPEEFEVVVIDDGSTDGTREAMEQRHYPFALRYFRQQGGGPGTARNLGIEHATGELVVFIGDDILADERLLEEHLLAHAADRDPGLAILGHIDWPRSMTPNAVMDCVCGDAKLQFAYADIPKLPALDHRFFYTSNISLKRQFLVEAANSGIRFDPGFRRAAFEDSEFAFRLIPRGLRIRYAEQARAAHDHWMDLDSFAQREFGAGEMAVVFYRKHPGQDALLKVKWIADTVKPALALLEQPQFLSHLEAFDRQTDTMLRALAGALEELIALDGQPGSSTVVSLSANRLRAALNNLLRAIFDVERTRGKLQEWYATVDDPAKVRAAQTLASVMRKLEFLGGDHPIGLQSLVAPLDPRVVADLNGRLSAIPGVPVPEHLRHPVRARVRTLIRRHVATPSILSRVIAADRFVESRLQSAAHAAWLRRYRSLRNRLRRGLM